MRQCQSRSSSQRAFPTHVRALLPHRVDELDDVHLSGEVAVEARARKSLPVALHRPAAVLGRQRPWGRLIDAVRQYTSPGAAFVSITPASRKCILPFPYQRSKLAESGLGQRTAQTRGEFF